MRPIYGNPLFGRRDPGLFEIWRLWARELGLTFEPYHDLEERKPYTGRRDKDRQPRFYELDNDKYGMDPKTGAIWRRPNT